MKYFFLFFSLFFFSACNLFFEEDLSKIKVELLTPPDNYNSKIQTQEFIWEAMEGADEYQFQIVSKSFAYIEEYILDTTLTSTKFSITLEPKEYEWRVIGKNSAGESAYDEYKLTITDDTTLAGQIINTILPNDNDSYTKDSIAFWWYKLNNAQNYQLQVATHPSFNSQTITQNVSTSNDYYYLINTLGIGQFYWRIRALRGNVDTTTYTTTKTFTIDAAPIHNSPNNNSAVVLPLTINWSTTTNVAKDSLFLYYNNSTTPFKAVELSSPTYQFTNTDTLGRGTGTYYWQIRSVGNNGYISSKSNLWQFSIN